MSEEKKKEKYKCVHKNNTYGCVKTDDHGYSEETCNNVCGKTCFYSILPKITISTGPLSDIAFGITKWLGIAQDEKYLRYPFGDEYAQMFEEQSPSNKKLLEEFINFLKFKPNILVMRAFVLYYLDQLASDIHTEHFNKITAFRGIEKIYFQTIKINIATHKLGEPVLPTQGFEKPQLLKNFDFSKHIIKATDDLMPEFKEDMTRMRIRYPDIADQEVISDLLGYITSMDYEFVTNAIIKAFNSKMPFSSIKITYISTTNIHHAHANILIFDRTNGKNKIYYIEPHGRKYMISKVFIEAFRNCFINTKFFNKWSIEFLTHQTQQFDELCVSWSFLSLLCISNNDEYDFMSVLLFFINLQSSVNVMMVWYFSLFNQLYKIMPEHFKGQNITEFIKENIQKFQTLPYKEQNIAIRTYYNSPQDLLIALLNKSIKHVATHEVDETGNITDTGNKVIPYDFVETIETGAVYCVKKYDDPSPSSHY